MSDSNVETLAGVLGYTTEANLERVNLEKRELEKENARLAAELNTTKLELNANRDGLQVTKSMLHKTVVELSECYEKVSDLKERLTFGSDQLDESHVRLTEFLSKGSASCASKDEQLNALKCDLDALKQKVHVREFDSIDLEMKRNALSAGKTLIEKEKQVLGDKECAGTVFQEGFSDACETIGKLVQLCVNDDQKMLFINDLVDKLYDKIRKTQNADECYDPALVMCSQAIAIESSGRKDKQTLARLWNRKVVSYFFLGRYQEAVECATKAIKHDPTSEKLFKNRASAYYLLNDSVKARKDAEKAVELNPDDQDAKDLLSAINSVL